jgi:hypothetical protein
MLESENDSSICLLHGVLITFAVPSGCERANQTAVKFLAAQFDIEWSLMQSW